MSGYDAEEVFWKNQHTEEDAMRTIVWGATDLESFNKNTPMESNFIAETLGMTKDDIVLDYGAGMGRLAKAIAPCCKEVVGLDVSNAMVGHSRKYLKDVKNAQVLHCTSIGQAPIKQTSIDKIYSHIVLQHIHPYKVVFILSQLKKYLVPGGKGLFQFPDIAKDKGAFMGYAGNFVSNEENNCSVHFWSKDMAKKVFEHAGWKVVDFIDWESDFWVIAE